MIFMKKKVRWDNVREIELLKMKYEIYQTVLEAIVFDNPDIIVKEMDGIEREIKVLERIKGKWGGKDGTWQKVLCRFYTW